ncbi:LIGHT-REGULATED PROTEIN-LIKE [Salix koriyanagi]|uniref:LIGHT-REGULATED PROTEIN-LIKE n=1 Tax=Salix koriyanagi TaxID=2511006 RepID=A0A9Q0Q925_9ROSI|nr:LIGHT-REGULATED PROTEIN-LIKE [Salix koriyanagi]
MQAAVFLSPSLLPLVSPNKSLASARRVVPRLQTSQCSPIKASAPVANDASTVDYSSVTSVFPAEACETVGGEACDVEMYPEVKLKPDARSTTLSTSEQIDREYLEYDSAKTVFVDEACDDLGGEFCDPGYQG